MKIQFSLSFIEIDEWPTIAIQHSAQHTVNGVADKYIIQIQVYAYIRSIHNHRLQFSATHSPSVIQAPQPICNTCTMHDTPTTDILWFIVSFGVFDTHNSHELLNAGRIINNAKCSIEFNWCIIFNIRCDSKQTRNNLSLSPELAHN